jgi:hypothetical protein
VAEKKTANVAAKVEDVVLLGPPLASGEGRHVLRKRGERIEHGALRPMVEGKPLTGELVKLERRADAELYDVEVLHDARSGSSDDIAAGNEAAMEPAGLERSGPAQVATDEYRRGWNRLFHKKALPS